MREEGFAGDAVPVFVVILVNVSLIVELLEDVLNALFVAFVGSPYKVAVGRAHEIPKRTDLRSDSVNVLLGRDSGFESLVFYFLSVFVGSGKKIYVETALTLITRDSVRHYYLEGVSEVRLL